ncbi:MAG: DMT family transporter, partial [Anaerovoracaceae bacterium]
GMAHTTGIKGSVINSSDVFFAMFAAHFLIRGERVTWRKMIGCIIGFAGVFSVNLQPGAWDSGFGFLGDGMIVLSSVMYGVSSVTLKLIADRETPMCITSWQLFLGGLLLTAAGFLTGGRIGGFQLSSVLLLFYMALLSTVAFSLWSMLLKYNQVGQVAIFGFSIPIFGSLLSALILGEKLFSLQNLAALALVSAGILVVNGVLPIKSGKYKS